MLSFIKLGKSLKDEEESMHKQHLLVVLMILVSLSQGSFLNASENRCNIVDKGGNRFSISHLDTTEFILKMDNNVEAHIAFDRITEIKRLNDRDEWVITPLQGPSLQGLVEGEITGDFSFGTFKGNLPDLVSLLFPDRVATGEWIENKGKPFAATVRLANGLTVRANVINNSKRILVPTGHGGPNLWYRKHLCLENETSMMLIDLKYYKKLSLDKGIATITLNDGEVLSGKLSPDESFGIETDWGSMDFPQSTIADINTTADLYWDYKKLLNWQEWAIEAVQTKYPFKGYFLTTRSEKLFARSLMLEYACNWTARWGRGPYNSGVVYFVADGIPCLLSGNRIDLKSEMIKEIAVIHNQSSDDDKILLSVTGVDGNSIGVELIKGHAQEFLGSYYASGGTNVYTPLALWGMTDFGFIRVRMPSISRVERQANQ